MKFQATDEQVCRLAACVVNASEKLRYGAGCEGDWFSPEDFSIGLCGENSERRCVQIDYWRGRRVKLYLLESKTKPSQWSLDRSFYLEPERYRRHQAVIELVVFGSNSQVLDV